MENVHRSEIFIQRVNTFILCFEVTWYDSIIKKGYIFLARSMLHASQVAAPPIGD